MGRKNKLRREKQARRRKIETASSVTATAAASAVTTSAVTQTQKRKVSIEDEILCRKSTEENHMRWAIEYGCITSMRMLGIYYLRQELNGSQIHLSSPWFLEDAIRGNERCVMYLMQVIYFEAKPGPPKALISYWTTMIEKYCVWDDILSSGSSFKSEVKKSGVI